MIQEYRELLALTELYLLQEHSVGDWLFTDEKTYIEMKQFAQASAKAKGSPAPLAPAPLPRPTPAPALQKRIPPKRTTPTPPPEEKKPTESVSHQVERQQVTVETKEDFQDLRKIIQEKHPEVSLSDQIPHDRKAHEVNGQWKERERIVQVLLLSFDSNPSHTQFLQRLASAIDDHFVPAKMITPDEFKAFPTEKILLVIGVEKELQANPIFEKVPTLSLSEINEYLQNPKLKIPLWKEISSRLNP